MALPNRIVRALGYIVLALVVFVFAVQLTFPYDRVRDKVVDTLSEKYDITINGVERGWLPGHVTFTGIQFSQRPTKPDDVVTRISIPRLDLSVGLFAAMHGTVAVDLDAQIQGPRKPKSEGGSADDDNLGRLRGSIVIAPSAIKVNLDAIDLPGSQVPWRDMMSLPLPILGKLQLGVVLDLPMDASKVGKPAPDWTKAEASVELSCTVGCQFGDGHSKLKIKTSDAKAAAFEGDGIEFKSINIDSLLIHVDLKDGKAELSKFEVKSGDGELHLDLNVALQQQILGSVVDGCLRFKGSEALQKREPKLSVFLTTTRAPLAPDGLWNIKLTGPLRDVKRLGQLCGASAPNGGTGTTPTPSTPSTPRRPGLSNTPPPAEPAPHTEPVAPPPHSEPSAAAGGQGPGSMPPPPPPPPPPNGTTVEGSGSGSAALEGSAGSAEGSGSAEPKP